MKVLVNDNRIYEPTIDTERLILRPLRDTDANVVQFLTSDKTIASASFNLGRCRDTVTTNRWIRNIKKDIAEGKRVVFAITENNNGNLLGTIGLKINAELNEGEISYWIGNDYWGNGYCTEAAFAVLRYGFENLGLRRIFGHHIKGNDASGRVMQKVGMKYEGASKSYVEKWCLFKNLKHYGMDKKDYKQMEQYYRLTGIDFSARYSFI